MGSRVTYRTFLTSGPSDYVIYSCYATSYVCTVQYCSVHMRHTQSLHPVYFERKYIILRFRRLINILFVRRNEHCPIISIIKTRRQKNVERRKDTNNDELSRTACLRTQRYRVNAHRGLRGPRIICTFMD